MSKGAALRKRETWQVSRGFYTDVDDDQVLKVKKKVETSWSCSSCSSCSKSDRGGDGNEDGQRTTVVAGAGRVGVDQVCSEDGRQQQEEEEEEDATKERGNEEGCSEKKSSSGSKATGTGQATNH